MSRRARRLVGAAALVTAGCLVASAPALSAQDAPRPWEAGVRIGSLAPGPHDAITDVPGVLVGHATLAEGDSLNTGVTAILPHGGDLFRERVRAAIVVGNGYGKLVGLSQVQELGELETPILLTGTLSVFRAADALIDTLLASPGNEEIRSINPVVGETNDGFLSDIRARPIGPEHVRTALREARSGAVAEGAVGAGRGTRALGFKGGIGTASRVVAAGDDSWTVGVLVQTNFGGSLIVDGVPVGERLAAARGEPHDARGGGSVMIVIATDAPLDHRHLERLAERSFGGLARAGASLSHGSGDYAIAFTVDRDAVPLPGGGGLSRLFVAVRDATEEAIVASLFAAETVTGHMGAAEALPVGRTLELLERAGALADD
ncbi:MAG: P1 family peptidase [Gemmatimonadota bacterium]